MNSRRSKKSAAARLRPFWILFAVLLAGALFAGYYGATWPGFRVRLVIIRGNRVVSRSEILARAAISGATNIWLQDPWAMRERIQTIPYVGQVRVERKLPAEVLISVTERMPYALVGKTAPVLVDRALRVLETHPKNARVPLFEVDAGIVRAGAFLRRPQILAMRDDYGVLLAAHARIRTLRVDSMGELTAWMASGVAVRLGDDEALLQKVRLIEPILAQTQSRGKVIRVLDLRAPKTPVVVYR
ncbi:MAG: hypothetical protein DLM50_07960 [Candidatus Meridianibacter frigidus]|nr:MAG: hypothetical protein DLM50_07960 [Candidatus Eremiobacteraeota bacterium]